MLEIIESAYTELREVIREKIDVSGLSVPQSLLVLQADERAALLRALIPAAAPVPKLGEAPVQPLPAVHELRDGHPAASS